MVTTYESTINFERLGKEIKIFLNKGENLTLDNIVDIEVYPKDYWKKTPEQEEKYAKVIRPS